MSFSANDIQIITKSHGLLGTVELPADKSIAHRAALFSSIGSGTSHIVGYPDSEDPQSTLSCLRQLGIQIEEDEVGLAIHGRGLHGFKESDESIYCGNSGTTMRLLVGILAGQTFSSNLSGDASLSGRPMGRIIDPLARMGSKIESEEGHAPLHIVGEQHLNGIEYELPIASAQVKSCVLLAGLYGKGTTTVVEHAPSRDHTERMLGLSSITIGNKRHISIEGNTEIPARMWSIPADFSAAAFFLVAGSIVPNSEIKLPRVGLNPTRTGLIDILRAMGADITVENERLVSGEPIADLTVRSAALSGITVGGQIIANIIDEIPILAVAASVASGRTIIQDAAELRHKETDRIVAMATGLRTLGAEIEERPDGLVIEGSSTLTGGVVESYNDHRVAMSMAIAGLVSTNPVHIQGAHAAAVSFPSFWDTLKGLG